MLKSIFRERPPFKFTITIIGTTAIYNIIAEILYKSGYVQWLEECATDIVLTLLFFWDASATKYINAIINGTIGLTSSFAILYILLFVIPNVAAKLCIKKEHIN